MSSNTPDPEQCADDPVEFLRRIAEEQATQGIDNTSTIFDTADAAGIDRTGNANAFVPWSDPMIPFECDCGKVIYSDTMHVHGDE
jgi:hypothetical protein